MVTRYAVHCEHVAFSIKKHGEAGASFSVAVATTKIDRIKQAYGAAVAKELIAFDTEDQTWGFKASGYCSTANYTSKRTTILLFINHRSVESSAVKKAVEQAYQLFLPKGGHPFVYLNLEIDPARVDVNVHPTKREVHFLSEDEIIDKVCTSIRERLTQVDTSRTFKTQTLIPTISPNINRSRSKSEDTDGHEGHNLTQNPRTPASKRPYENNLVRTDSKLRKITSMLPPALTPSQSVNRETTDPNASLDSSSSPTTARHITIDRDQVPIRLTSIKTLRSQVRDNVHTTLTETFASLTYIGLVDSQRRLAAMQSGVKLYLIDYGVISNELFYQIGITDFGNFGTFQLRPSEVLPLRLRDILLIGAGIEVETDASLVKDSPSVIAEQVYNQLYARREMMKEYFNLEIDDEGHLLTVPLLIKNYIPCMAKLPTFMIRLGPCVNWTDEMECFRTFLIELAAFYVPEKLSRQKVKSSPQNEDSLSRPPVVQGAQNGNDDEASDDLDADMHMDIDTNTPQNDPVEQQEEEEEDRYMTKRRAQIEYALEHVLFPAFRSRLLATQGMVTGVVEVADLKGLYRVFERC